MASTCIKLQSGSIQGLTFGVGTFVWEHEALHDRGRSVTGRRGRRE